MAYVLSTVPTSRRSYLSQAELAQYADIQIIDPTEADDQISQAEEIIDAYVGPQDKFISRQYSETILGKAQSGDATHVTLESRHMNIFMINFLTGCEMEIIGGSCQGQRRIIVSNTYPNTVVTMRDAFDSPIDNTSLYRIYQLGSFPRKRDVYLDSINPPVPTYYKNIPEKVKRAVAAQVEFIIQQGANFFSSDEIFKHSERLGDYSYQKSADGSSTGIEQMIAPKAKIYLKGITNRRGIMIV